MFYPHRLNRFHYITIALWRRPRSRALHFWASSTAASAGYILLHIRLMLGWGFFKCFSGFVRRWGHPGAPERPFSRGLFCGISNVREPRTVRKSRARTSLHYTRGFRNPQPAKFFDQKPISRFSKVPKQTSWLWLTWKQVRRVHSKRGVPTHATSIWLTRKLRHTCTTTPRLRSFMRR